MGCMIETARLRLYAASQEQMEAFIAAQTVDALKAAYSEMLDGALAHPDRWEWYAIWMVELRDGTHVGEFCFKGIGEDGKVEIGYGVAEDWRGNGYATEAVSALVDWAMKRPGVLMVTAETEPSNVASQRVLEKAGFVRTGEVGAEGPRYVRKRTELKTEQEETVR